MPIGKNRTNRIYHIVMVIPSVNLVVIDVIIKVIENNLFSYVNGIDDGINAIINALVGILLCIELYRLGLT